jgi:hypothetical protein
MSSRLKYQSLIDSQIFTTPCPSLSLFESDKESFRWCCEPIEDKNNFLPNLIEDEVKNKPKRQLKGDEVHCESCAISFFDSLVNAKERFGRFPTHIRKLLGYTHVSKGLISKSDGLMGMPNGTGHFVLFEYEEVDLIIKFCIVDNL